jgi:uncharacterized membrane protein (DUF485 family)
MADTVPLSDGERVYYEEMSRARARIVTPLVLFTMVFYFLLPILTNFTSVLDGIPFEGMTWAYLYAFAQFVMVIVLTMYYRAAMGAVEARVRPPDIDETAAHYDDWQTWEKLDEAQEAEEGHRP